MFIHKETTQHRTIPHTHIENTNNWLNIWNNIEQSMNQRLQQKWKKYQKQ
jgi:hypothetical protein